MDEIKEFQLTENLKVAVVPVESLSQRRENYRAMNAQEKEALQSSIKKFGFQSLIAVRPHEGGYQIIDGHHRKEALEKLGQKFVPVAIIDREDTEIDLAMLSFNVTASIVPDVYMDFLQDLSSKVGPDVLAQFTAQDEDFLAGLSTGINDLDALGNGELDEGEYDTSPGSSTTGQKRLERPNLQTIHLPSKDEEVNWFLAMTQEIFAGDNPETPIGIALFKFIKAFQHGELPEGVPWLPVKEEKTTQ